MCSKTAEMAIYCRIEKNRKIRKKFLRKFRITVTSDYEKSKLYVNLAFIFIISQQAVEYVVKPELQGQKELTLTGKLVCKIAPDFSQAKKHEKTSKVKVIG